MPVPTYDQQFPSLGGGPGVGSDGSQPAPFGRWNAKPRVQSTTITQVLLTLYSFNPIPLDWVSFMHPCCFPLN